jgi:hypothetical protein
MSLLNDCLGDIEPASTIVHVDDSPLAYSNLVGKPPGNGYDQIVSVYLRDLLADQMQIAATLIERDAKDEARTLALDGSMERNNLILHWSAPRLL